MFSFAFRKERDTVIQCIGSLCQINRVKHLFDARTLERVINALVFSKLYYCSPVWSNTSKIYIYISRSCTKFRILLVALSLESGNLII